MQIPTDAFNLANSMVQAATARPTSPAVGAFAALNSSPFGQIWNALKIQFAMKFTF